MKRKGEARAAGDLNGFLDDGSHIQGELHFEDTFRLDGKVRGRVVSRGDLVIGEKGEVEGEIDVSRVFISGVARGTVKATERIEITANGKVYADVETRNLTIEDGGLLQGRCTMHREGLPKPDEVPEGSFHQGGVVTNIPLPKDLAQPD